MGVNLLALLVLWTKRSCISINYAKPGSSVFDLQGINKLDLDLTHKPSYAPSISYKNIIYCSKEAQ